MSTSTEGLKRRVLRAGSWVLGGHAATQVIRLASNIALSRLLAPEAFGLMAVVYVMMIGLALFSDLGINQTVIQSRRSDEPVFLNTAWSLQILRGAAIGSVALLLGLAFGAAAHWGWVPSGTVYSDPRLPFIIGAFSIVALLQGLEPTRIGIARRQMQQHLLTRIELISQVCAAAAMLTAAWITHSIWALFFGAVVAAGSKCYLAHRWLPGHHERWQLDRISASELLGHGKWILAASMLGFVAINGDRVVLGGLIDNHHFGLYTTAFLLVNTLQVVASMLCNNVAYPALSEVARDRPQGLNAALAKFQWVYDGLVVTLAAMLLVSGPAVVDLLYDDRYREAGWMLSTLAAGAIGLRYQLVEQCYMAMGAPRYITLSSLVRLLALLAGLLLGHHFYGLTGAVAGIAISQYATWPIAWWFKARHRLLNWRAECVLPVSLTLGASLGWCLARTLEMVLAGN